MFISRISTQTEIGPIYCVPFENTPHKQECKLTFKRDFSNDDLVIYTFSSNEFIFLGYLVIDNMHISKSKYYSNFVLNQINLFNIVPTESLSKIECVHIAEWKFEEVLKQKEILYSIFNTLISAYAEEDYKVILWCDGNKNLIFYPLEIIIKLPLPSAISYFTEKFLEEL
ncbi:MAG: hypothetical protein HUK13_05785 [Muribaculaceae bacterium]|nr:hypothetical protein [Muribaculaceae bacterium]MCF0213942.1 hypothetical protein [Muribaculaceae bacterium]